MDGGKFNQQHHPAMVGRLGSCATTVQGGTQYVFALTGDGSDARWAFTSGSMFYGDADYTGGFPSTIDEPTGYSELPCIRATFVAGGITGDFAGTVGSGSVSGTMAGTLGNVTGAVSGAHGVAGTAAGTLAHLTGSATGTVRAEGSWLEL